MFFITVIIYKKNIDEIVSLDSIKALVQEKEDIRVIVVDNSDFFYASKNEPAFMTHFDKTVGTYINMGDNAGLPKAYNKAIKYALKLERQNEWDKSFMLFVDDDTSISTQYLEHVYAEATAEERNTDKVNLITGMIESGGRPLSPVYGYRFRFTSKDYITEPGIYADAACINSAMAIRMSALKEAHGFDERLFLDMTDFTLMYKLSKKGLNSMLVIDEKIQQDFSGRDMTDRKATLARFEIYRKDFTTYCKITGKSRRYAAMGILKRRIAIQKKTR